MPRTYSILSILHCRNCKRDLPREAFEPKEWRGKIVGVKPSCRDCCEHWAERKHQRAIDGIPERFWSKVDRSGGPDACWPWTGAIRNKQGYGAFKIYVGNQAKMVIASRMAIELTQGSIPSGYLACHTCDNPPCCNPAHLYAGTPLQNVQDAQRKGIVPKKLTDEQVRQIRYRYIPRKMSYASLAVEYGVSMSTIRDVVKRYIAKHVE